jgi:hypothetical protein
MWILKKRVREKERKVEQDSEVVKNGDFAW